MLTPLRELTPDETKALAKLQAEAQDNPEALRLALAELLVSRQVITVVKACAYARNAKPVWNALQGLPHRPGRSGFVEYQRD